MAIDTSSPRSRRALLAAALGAGAATVATAVALPLSVSAADGDPMIVGGEYTASSVTKITQTTGFQPAIEGVSDSGPGVVGMSTSGRGAAGSIDSGIGIDGSSSLSPGVRGISDQNTGVQGYGGAVGTEPAAPAKTGVYGYAAQDATAIGVMGESNAGVAVLGVSTQGIGVVGRSSLSQGVRGESSADDAAGVGVVGESPADRTGVVGLSFSGLGLLPAPPAKTGVYGHAAQDATAVGVKGESTIGTGVLASATTGIALRVAGKARFSRSGRASVLAGKSYTDITVAGGLAASSVVHATLQTYRAGVSIAAVRTNYPSTGKARIYLTKVASTTASTSAGWFVAEY